MQLDDGVAVDDAMTLDDVIAHSSRIGRVAFVATTRADGRPHSAPVGIAWVDRYLCAFVQQPSVKVTNARRDPRVHVHWQVGPESNNDSLMIEGLIDLVDTPLGRTALWGRMGYDLSEFEPGGPGSNGHVFFKIAPLRATLLRRFGFEGRQTWQAESQDVVIDVRDPVRPEPGF